MQIRCITCRRVEGLQEWTSKSNICLVSKMLEHDQLSLLIVTFYGAYTRVWYYVMI